jgi:hypothetical protein
MARNENLIVYLVMLSKTLIRVFVSFLVLFLTDWIYPLYCFTFIFMNRFWCRNRNDVVFVSCSNKPLFNSIAFASVTIGALARV